MRCPSTFCYIFVVYHENVVCIRKNVDNVSERTKFDSPYENTYDPPYIMSIVPNMNSLLRVDNLYARVEGKDILSGVSLAIPAGEIHFLVGPNGSGKTTLANTLMGSPQITVTAGAVSFDGEEITALPPEERAKKGLHLWFQHPAEIAGVGYMPFLRSVAASRGDTLPPEKEFRDAVAARAEELEMPVALLERNLNEGFSGGEKKRSELLQLAVFAPRFAILDECDSGLDVDGIRAAAKALQAFRDGRRSLLVITHHGALREYLHPDAVHVMARGRIVASGGEELAIAIERDGFGQFGA